jgi:type IX secretion system PorP/SprF family membrane protein
MIKRIFFSAVFMLAIGQCFAQHLPQFSQYFFNDFAINPAIAGTRKLSEIVGTNRNQWVGITDAPRTFVLSCHGPLSAQNMGIGGTIFTDVTGPTRRIGANFAYSYHVKIAPNTKVAMGLSAGILQFAIDASKITIRDQGDMFFSSNIQSTLVPDFGAGIHVYHDKYFFGVSAPQLFGNKLHFFSQETQANLQNHFFATAGYRFSLNEEWVLQPMVLVKHVKPVPVQLDLSTRVIWQDKLWAGFTYRTNDAVVAMLGFTYQEQFLFGYSFDYAVSGLRKYSSGSHEIMLGLRFKTRKGI